MSFFSALGTFIQDDLVATVQLSPDVWRLTGVSGRSYVFKTVPRQERARWKPGSPWAELVALDVLSDAGAPVPKLLAADVHHGWLLMEFAEGVALSRLRGRDGPRVVTGLVVALDAIHKGLMQASEVVERFVVANLADERDRLSRLVESMLNTDIARRAWREMVGQAFTGEQAYLQLGSCDLRPENAIWHEATNTLALIDFATLGWAFREQRMVAYSHRASQDPGTLLTSHVYHVYAQEAGMHAAYRLAVYDFAYWAMAWQRAETTNDHGRRSRIEALWRTRRLHDSCIDAVTNGLPNG